MALLFRRADHQIASVFIAVGHQHEARARIGSDVGVVETIGGSNEGAIAALRPATVRSEQKPRNCMEVKEKAGFLAMIADVGSLFVGTYYD